MLLGYLGLGLDHGKFGVGGCHLESIEAWQGWQGGCGPRSHFKSSWLFMVCCMPTMITQHGVREMLMISEA